MTVGRAALAAAFEDLKARPFPGHPHDDVLAGWVLDLAELDGHIAGLASTALGSSLPHVAGPPLVPEHARRLAEIRVVGEDERIYSDCLGYIRALERVEDALGGRRRWIGHELIREALLELSDESYQRRVWTAASGPEIGSLTEAMCSLFDDSGLGDALDAGREVYGSLIAGMLRELGDLLGKIDQLQHPERLLRDPLLIAVRQQAAAILARLD